MFTSSNGAVCANADQRRFYKTCLLRSHRQTKLWFLLKYAVDRLHEHQRASSRVASREYILNHSSVFLPPPQLDFSHHYQRLVTTVDYTERPADLMELNDWASPANTDSNVFPRWRNGKSVIFTACCWAGTAERQLSLRLVIPSHKSWHR